MRLTAQAAGRGFDYPSLPGGYCNGFPDRRGIRRAPEQHVARKRSDKGRNRGRLIAGILGADEAGSFVAVLSVDLPHYTVDMVLNGELGKIQARGNFFIA